MHAQCIGRGSSAKVRVRVRVRIRVRLDLVLNDQSGDRTWVLGLGLGLALGPPPAWHLVVWPGPGPEAVRCTLGWPYEAVICTLGWPYARLEALPWLAPVLGALAERRSDHYGLVQDVLGLGLRLGVGLRLGLRLGLAALLRSLWSRPRCPA